MFSQLLQVSLALSMCPQLKKMSCNSAGRSSRVQTWSFMVRHKCFSQPAGANSSNDSASSAAKTIQSWYPATTMSATPQLIMNAFTWIVKSMHLLLGCDSDTYIPPALRFYGQCWHPFDPALWIVDQTLTRATQFILFFWWVWVNCHTANIKTFCWQPLPASKYDSDSIINNTWTLINSKLSPLLS
jgi:hypothetical protein